MFKMKFLPVWILLLLVCGFCAPKLAEALRLSHDRAEELADGDLEAEEDEGRDTVSVSADEDLSVPPFVQQLLEHAQWEVQPICSVGGKTYCFAYEEFHRTSVIYDDDRILLSAPVIQIDSFLSDRKDKLSLSVVGKSMVVDFTDPKSLERMASLSRVLPSFSRYSQDRVADFGSFILYDIALDYPQPSVAHAGAIRRWVVGLVGETLSSTDEIPAAYAKGIGYSKRADGRWAYQGDVNQVKPLMRSTANLYFALKKAEYGTEKDDYPGKLFACLNLQARLYNPRFVTYQRFTYGYDGGMHGFYTECLVSFDHVHQQKIDCAYLFRPECMKEVLAILLEEAKQSSRYLDWNADIMQAVSFKNSDGTPSTRISLPTPGLSETGVVFSFQPYDITAYAAGTFHFTLPYSRIKHCLTPRAKWCIGLTE